MGGPGRWRNLVSDCGTVERAFELAKGGKCRTMTDIRRQLNVEQFSSVEAHLSWPTVRRQLCELMQASLPNSNGTRS
jgi:hypothetical protein